jgi:hypothetical protein
VGCDALASLIPDTTVWLSKLGSVTTVGVFAVKLPAAQPSVSVSFSTVVVSEGSVQLAAVPAVTAPPPLAFCAT